ncbi:hypothetical protein GJ496_005664 [Pomphorhynchus laevis]|nr:hypothetical protein GJ496_005664 [Pomphorhynchus laevis]
MSNKKPKGRMSAYTFFVQTCRDEHRRWYPDENVNFTEFSKKCSARWKLMTEEQKSRFVEMSNGDKHRYESEMAKYNPPSGESRKRKKRDPLAPKRPLSAFFLFCQEERPKVREEHPSASISEIAKVMGEKWSKIDPERKKAYEEDAIRAKANYDREAAIYREKSQQQQAISVATTAKRPANQMASSSMIAMQQRNQLGNGSVVAGSPNCNQSLHSATNMPSPNSVVGQAGVANAAATAGNTNTALEYCQAQMARVPAASMYQQQMMMLNNANAANAANASAANQHMMNCLTGESSPHHHPNHHSNHHQAHMYHINSPQQLLHHHHQQLLSQQQQQASAANVVQQQQQVQHQQVQQQIAQQQQQSSQDLQSFIPSSCNADHIQNASNVGDL